MLLGPTDGDLTNRFATCLLPILADCLNQFGLFLGKCLGGVLLLPGLRFREVYGPVLYMLLLTAPGLLQSGTPLILWRARGVGNAVALLHRHRHLESRALSRWDALSEGHLLFLRPIHVNLVVLRVFRLHRTPHRNDTVL